MLRPVIASLLIYFCCIQPAEAQNIRHFMDDGTIGCAFNDLPGFIWAHSEKNRNINAPGNSFELQIIKKTQGARPWEIKYKLPRVSLALMYTDFGKPNLTGKAFSIIPQFEFSMIRRHNAELNFKLGTGLGYLTKIFDAQDNYKNTTIGAPLNLAFQAMFMYHHRLYKNIELSAGLGLMHFSCGNIRLPNLGINYPTASIGASYFLANPYTRHVPKMDSASVRMDTTKHIGYSVFGGWAYKEQGVRKFRRFDVFILSNNFQYRVSMRSTWLAGVDIFYDKSFFYLHTPDSSNYTSPVLKDNFQSAITVGHELKAGRVSFISQLGAYVYDPYKVKRPVYQRLGLKLDLHKGFYVGSFLKTHFIQADFVEWIVGYSLLK